MRKNLFKKNRSTIKLDMKKKKMSMSLKNKLVLIEYKGLFNMLLKNEFVIFILFIFINIHIKI